MRLSLPSGTPCELALPPAGNISGGRGVVLAPDIFGLRPLFDELCAHLAKTYGWAVCAIEPFPGRAQLTLEERMGAVSQIDDADYLGDLRSAAEVIDGHGATTVGVMGFCMGGMYALKAASMRCFDRSVSFYGMIRVPAHWEGHGQGEPLDALTTPGACEVLAIIGGLDHWTPPADVAALEAAGAQVIRYPEADHGFVHDPSRPAHRPDDAADAWKRVEAFMHDVPRSLSSGLVQ